MHPTSEERSEHISGHLYKVSFSSLTSATIMGNHHSSLPSKKQKNKTIAHLQEKYDISKEDLNHLVESLERRYEDGMVTMQGLRQSIRATFFYDSSSKKIEDSLVAIFDRNHSGNVDILEYVETILEIQNMSAEEKIQVAFDVFDTNRSGFLERDEVRHIVKAFIGSKIPKESDRERLVERIWDKLDVDKDNRISRKEFKKVASLEPEISNALQGLFVSTF
mmetsp:Transcript_884/g.3074  ORF Transcript_884/g.3074 Transcript_884/m.3074 type:complete len:221 (-) Transcript_884:2093-2755(-)